MGSNLYKHTLSYIFIGFLPVAANFFLAPIYTRFLVPEQYALVGIAVLVQAFLTFFLSLSLDGAFSRLFFDYEKQGREKYTLLSTLLSTVTIVSVITLGLLLVAGNSLFGFFFKNKEFTFSGYGIWVHLTTYSNVIFLFFSLLYRNEERIRSFVISNLAFFFIPVIGTLYGLVVLKQGAEGAIIGRAAGSMFVAVALVLSFFYRHPLKVNRTYLKKSLTYSLPLLPYQLMFAAFSNIDRVILERFFVPRVFGIYNFAALLSGLVPVFINALNNAMYPKIYRELGGAGDRKTVRSINFGSFIVLQAIICIAVAIVVPLMRVFISKEYAASYEFVAILFLSFMPYLHYLIYTLPFFYHGKTKVFPVVSFCALAAGILFNLIFIPLMGLWAVCISLYVIRGIQLLAIYLYARIANYHSLSYLQQSESFWGSFTILCCYNAALGINNYFKFLPIDLVNLIPIVVFGIVCFTFYRRQILELFVFSRRGIIFDANSLSN